MIVNDSKKSQKVAHFLRCEICDYNTSKKSDYKKHLSTDKHKNRQNSTFFNNCQQKSSANICECGKAYKERTGLYKHKKHCIMTGTFSSKDISQDLIIELIKDNKELKQLLLQQTHTISEQSHTILEQSQSVNEQNTKLTTIVNDVVKNGVNNNNSHNTTTNSHNKAFNINVFLNETCKDAINMSDFISSIKMSLDDLEHTGRVGYIEGISNILVKNLNNLENHMRPLHCSDLKREVIYIKNNNEWTKETDQKPILTRAIKTVAGENIKQIKHWKDKHPDCTNADSKKNNLYLKIVSNSMNGLTEEEGNKNINKIISNLAKEVVIDKTNT